MLLYWLTTLILLLIVVILPALVPAWNGNLMGMRGIGGQIVGSMLTGFFFFLLGAPLIQLVAAVPPALILAFSQRTDKGRQFAQLGKIVLGVVVGGLIGLLIMVVLGVLIEAIFR